LLLSGLDNIYYPSGLRIKKFLLIESLFYERNIFIIYNDDLNLVLEGTDYSERVLKMCGRKAA
jgi:hypothetical protein